MNESSLAKWLRWMVYACAFVPLIIFSQYMSPFHFGKVIVFRSVVQMMLVLYIMLIWRDRSYLPKSHAILWAFLAFTGAFILTTITSVAPLQSWWGTLERMGGLFSFLHYPAFFIMMVSVLRTRRDWQVLLDIMIGVGVASAIYGFLQKTDWTWILGSGGRARPFGTIGNAALFAGYELLVSYLALTLSLLKRTTQSWRVWYWIASATMALAVLMTAVRGSLLGLVVSALLMAVLWSVLHKSRRGKNILLGSITVVVLTVFLALLLRNTSLVQNSPYLRRVTDVSSKTYTVQTRFWAWSAAFQGWSESPRTVLVGWGPENFNVPFSHYFNPKFFQGPGSETFFDRAHNMFVEVLTTMGLVGELTYLALFGTLFWTLAQCMKREGDERTLGIGLAAMTVAYMIHNSFIFDTSANFITFFMILGFATYVSVNGVGGNDKSVMTTDKMRKGREWTGAQIAAAGVLSIVAIVTVYATNIVPAKANYAVTRAIVAGWQGDWTTSVNKYREAIDYDVPGRYEYRHRFAQYLLELSSVADVSKVPNFPEVMQQAIIDVKANVAENPSDYLPLLYLSRLYITLGKESSTSPFNDVALEYSTRALDISPTFVRTYYEVAQVYLNKEDPQMALEWFTKAAQLQPEVGLTYWYMAVARAQIALAIKDVKGVQEALQMVMTARQKNYQLTEADSQKLVMMYGAVGDIESIEMIYSALTNAFPKKAAYWEQLVAAQLQLNRVREAAASLHTALAIPEVAADTAFKTKAEALLRQLGL